MIPVGLGLGFGSGLGLGSAVRVRIKVRVRFRVANCCIQTAGEGDKMRINHVIKTDQWRFTLQIRPTPHFCRVPFSTSFRLNAISEQLLVNHCMCLACSIVQGAGRREK